MFSFNLKGKSGILIFTLFNYRLGEGLSYSGPRLKRLNSYALFNTENREMKILHYDYIKARIYDDSISAYTISPGEQFIGLRGSSCYYIDHNGQEVGYAGDLYFFHTYETPNDSKEKIDNQDIENNIEKEETIRESDYKIEGNKIIYDNGELYETDFLLKKKFENIIVCYKEFDNDKKYTSRLFGICDRHGNLLSEIKYDDIWASDEQIIRNKYLRVKIQGKFGLITFDGKEILPAIFGFIDDCDGSIAIVNHGKKLIKTNDLSVIFETEGRIRKKVDGWMKVESGDYPATSFGLLDSSGNLYQFYNKKKYWGKKEFYLHLGASFHDGLLPVFSPKRGFGYVDIDSNEIIECKYCEISDFENGKAKVRLDCEYGYINAEGCMLVKKEGKEIAIPKIYDWAYNFNNGYFVVQQGKLYGAIDENLSEIIPCSLKTKEEVELTYSRIKLHSLSLSAEDYIKKYKDSLPPIRYKENELYGFKSENGEMIFPPVLKVGQFVEGMAIIDISGRKGFINESLDLVIQPIYDYALNFSEGLALVHKIGKGHMFINKLGEAVILCDYHQEKIQSFSNGIARCEYNLCIPGKDNENDEITKYCIGYETT